MQQYQKPTLVQEQKLHMSPQLLQSIQLMALPLQDLKTRIEEELEKNPALEIIEDPATVTYDETPPRHSEVKEYFEDSSDAGFPGGSYDDEAGDAKRKFMEGALSRAESLQDHLLWQLSLQPILEELRSVCELLIYNLDENGFHREDPQTLLPPDKLPLLEEAIRLIQRFDPVGVGVKDYRESLIVQAQQNPAAPPYTVLILQDHLEALERGKIKEIAKKLKISEKEVEDCLAFIKTLTPYPGREFSSETPRYVIPDLMVTLKEGQFVIILNDEEIPVLGLNPFFANIQNHPEAQKLKEVKQFVNNRIKEARWFIQSIHQRNQTLLKVAKAIVEFQRDFFLKGPKYLRPLTLKDIASEIGVHEATVSRITTSKYIQTEWGIFELKYFFSNSISGAGSGGSTYSKEAVKQIIKEIIEQEGGKNLSDQKIADLLGKRGIQLARRTVTKYRKELFISSSYER
ncbi:MAG: RNA polymerase factor sigma-54 [Spirochaetales bacterium]